MQHYFHRRAPQNTFYAREQGKQNFLFCIPCRKCENRFESKSYDSIPWKAMRSRITWKHVDREAWIDMNHVKIFHTHRNDSFRIRIYIYMCVYHQDCREIFEEIFSPIRDARPIVNFVIYLSCIYLLVVSSFETKSE